MSEISSVSSQKTIDQIIANNEANKIGNRNTGELGKDDFLQLLITQLQHQDPMNPSSDQDFIAQIAQFSSLEQMKNMSTSMSYQQGVAMMGKYVSALVKNETTGNSSYVSGEVSSVKMVDGVVKLVVGEDVIDIDTVLQVSDSSESVGGSIDINKFNTLIGLLGTFSLAGEDGLSTSIEGIVSKIEKSDDGPLATIDEVTIIPEVDKGAFDSIDAYLETMVGRNVSFLMNDKLTGASTTVTGMLRQFETNADGSTSVTLDAVEVPVVSLTATRRVDLFSSDTLLLAQILETLRARDEAEANDSTDETATTDLIDSIVESGATSAP